MHQQLAAAPILELDALQRVLHRLGLLVEVFEPPVAAGSDGEEYCWLGFMPDDVVEGQGQLVPVFFATQIEYAAVAAKLDLHAPLLRISKVLSQVDDPELREIMEQAQNPASPPAQHAGKSSAQQQGSLRYFMHAFLQQKTLVWDILFASLALQLIGLVTPMLTQVVVDKVIVHHTTSTLIAVGVGLFIAAAFSGCSVISAKACSFISATVSTPTWAIVSSPILPPAFVLVRGTPSGHASSPLAWCRKHT